MPHRIKSAAKRAILSKLLIELVRGVAVSFLGESDYGSCAPEVILACGVFIGQATGEPMTISSLARFVGMPRPSVYRRLKAMEKKGLARITGTGGRATLSLTELNSDTTMKMVRHMEMVVRDACVSLSLSESNS